MFNMSTAAPLLAAALTTLAPPTAQPTLAPTSSTPVISPPASLQPPSLNPSLNLTAGVSEGVNETALPAADDDDVYATFLDVSRYVVQRVLVPLVLVVGVVGNSVTIVVLTRRQMRSSTNNYLTALAISDLLYLVFIFSLSIRHHPGMDHPHHWFYWHYFRYALWLTDASSEYPLHGSAFVTFSPCSHLFF